MTRAASRAILAAVFQPLPKRAEDWRAVRERGEGRFLLWRGVLGRGVPMGLLLAVAIELYLGGTLPDSLATASFWGRALLGVAVFSASGCVSAHAQWRLLERRFERAGERGARG